MMEKLETAAMIDGVVRSAVFVLFLNQDTLSRKYVVLELTVALALGKPIVVMYESDARHGAPLDENGNFDRNLVFGNNTPGSTLEKEIDVFVEVQMKEDAIRDLIGAELPNVRAFIEEYNPKAIIPFVRRSPHWDAAYASLIAAAASALAEKGEVKESLRCFEVPKITEVKAGVSTSALILHTGNGEMRARELMERLIKRNVDCTLLGDLSGAQDLSHFSGVVFFCTDGFFENPQVESTALQAVASDALLIVVQEWSASHGGVLTPGLEWSFGNVFGEKQCKHPELRCITESNEAIRHRGANDLPLLVVSEDNVIVERLSAAVESIAAGPRTSRAGTLAAVSLRNSLFVRKLTGMPAGARARGSTVAGMRGRTESVGDGSGIAKADTWAEEDPSLSAEVQHDRRRSDHLLRSSQSFKQSTNPLTTRRRASTTSATKSAPGWAEHTDEDTEHFVSVSGEMALGQAPRTFTASKAASRGPRESDGEGDFGDAPSQRYGTGDIDL